MTTGVDRQSDDVVDAKAFAAIRLRVMVAAGKVDGKFDLQYVPGAALLSRIECMKPFDTEEADVEAIAGDDGRALFHPFGSSSNSRNRSPKGGGKRAGQEASSRPTPIMSRR